MSVHEEEEEEEGEEVRVLKSSCSMEECCRGRNTERGCIVSPHKVPVWLSAPLLELKAWYACAEHLAVQDTHLEKSEAVGGGLGTAW